MGKATDCISAGTQRPDMYRDIFESCADAILVVDTDYRVTIANASAESMFGQPLRQLAGQPIHMLIPENARTRHAAHIHQFRSSPVQARYMQEREAEICALRADGTEFPVAVSILKSGPGANTSLVAIVRDITEQKNLEKQLKEVAGTDPLTGLPNRRGFVARAEVEIQRATRYRHPMTIAMIDIDLFKNVNDTFGHAVGDRAICHVLDIIRRGLRAHDIIGRWGGEEFTLILTETPPESSINVLERLRCDVELSPFLTDSAGQNQSRLTVSIGAAHFGAELDTLETLISQSDEALYLAKQQGRNRLCVSAAIPGAMSHRPEQASLSSS